MKSQINIEFLFQKWCTRQPCHTWRDLWNSLKIVAIATVSHHRRNHSRHRCRRDSLKHGWRDGKCMEYRMLPSRYEIFNAQVSRYEIQYSPLSRYEIYYSPLSMYEIQTLISLTDVSLFLGFNFTQSNSWLNLSLFVKSAPGSMKYRILFILTCASWCS